MYARGANAYRKVAVESASPARILDELFVRLRRDIREAHDALDVGDVKTRCERLAHALRIVDALRSALDHTLAPDICTGLASLYGYAREQLFEANLRGDAKAIVRAEEVLVEIHEGFRAAPA